MLCSSHTGVASLFHSPEVKPRSFWILNLSFSSTFFLWNEENINSIVKKKRKKKETVTVPLFHVSHKCTLLFYEQKIGSLVTGGFNFSGMRLNVNKGFVQILITDSNNKTKLNFKTTLIVVWSVFSKLLHKVSLLLTHVCLCFYLSESRKGQTSGTGGVEGCSFARAMMCSKVMSVWVHTSNTWISCKGPWGRPLGVRLMTCTTTGSLALQKDSTVSSWLDLDRSFPFTWRRQEKVCCM